MKKTTAPSAKSGGTIVAADGKAEYRVKPGVEWINGRRVKDAKTVHLTAAEAAYDLGLSRITLLSGPIPKDWPSDKVEAGSANGGD